MTYDPYDRECSGDNETTTEQVYLRYIRMELQNVTGGAMQLVEAQRDHHRLVGRLSQPRPAADAISPFCDEQKPCAPPE